MKAEEQKLVPITRVRARAQRKRWHALLDDILDNGDSDMISAITLRLKIFSEMTTWPVARETAQRKPRGRDQRRDAIARKE